MPNRIPTSLERVLSRLCLSVMAGTIVACVSSVTALAQELLPSRQFLVSVAGDTATSYRDEWRMPVSYRQTPNGLEVAYVHEGVPRMRLSELAPGNSQGVLDRGDMIIEVNNQKVLNVGDLFSQLSVQNAQLPIGIININNNQKMSLIGSPRRVKVPMPMQKVSANGEGKIIVIHAVLTADNDIGKNLEVNLEPMKQLFDSTVDPKFLRSFNQVVGNECSARGIMTTLTNLSVGPQDTLLLYYQGHGAYSQSQANEDPAAGHYFDFNEKDLLRRNLLAAMLKKGARLTVLISDACNAEETVPIELKPVFEAMQVEVEGWTPLEELLLCHRGVLDLTSASRGQYAWSTSDIGGWFTSAFIGSLFPTNNVDVSWQASWNNIKQSTETSYQRRRLKLGRDNDKLRSQELMVPQELIWNIERDEPPVRPSGTRSITRTVSSVPGI